VKKAPTSIGIASTPCEDIERLADEDDERLGIDPDEWGEPYRVNGIDERPTK